MIETWKSYVDKGESFGTLLTDLSKTFDCLKHDLLLAKLRVYSLENNAIKLIFNYLTNRKQRVKIENTYSTWKDITSGVPRPFTLQRFPD